MNQTQNLDVSVGRFSARSIVQPLAPNGADWVAEENPVAALVKSGYPHQMWMHKTGLCVISAVEVTADLPPKGPEYHISISKWSRRHPGPQRCSSAEARWVLREFQLDGAEEDNHVPNGVVRNFWRAVADPLVGLECWCKASEPAIVEDKGDFVWRPVDKK